MEVWHSGTTMVNLHESINAKISLNAPLSQKQNYIKAIEISKAPLEWIDTDNKGNFGTGLGSVW